MSETQDPTPVTPSRGTILLVEDYDVAAQSLARLLRMCGYETTVVNDGSSAIEALMGGETPTFVLTDMQLPDIDGREVARFASQLPERPRIGLVTGWGADGTVGDPIEWGIDWVIEKPVILEDLIKLLSTHAPGHVGAVPGG